ncbi:zinc-dependent alcohol dehydrogenase family protein [Aspergillus affinis]|uniref:zinc-dependent alcohol dehydrogenase family protein n=1 Tax=Aspergillus affinis TaxID=1070780 RepID=UPI0022FEE266|nr:uncharacterized protein KD926_011657 [Aspergillus affinis]KAI9044687.1 hypothetical protein KD926_011657 [Aspergillus affinis]
MSIPQSYKAFRRTADGSTVEMTEEKLPSSLGPTQVLLRIYAVSLNYRDVAMMNGKYPVQVIDRGIPASDCAAEVTAVGSGVKDFSPGDHVAPIFDLNCINGTEDATKVLGGDVDGVLRQYAIFDQNVLVQLPKHLAWEEAACIVCAGTTAWLALDMPRSSGTALLQEKAQALGDAGVVQGINYKTHPNWDEQARELTGGRGVDIVVDNIGPTAMKRNLSCLARRGFVSLVGFLGGFKTDERPDVLGPVLLKSATVKGMNPGSKSDLQDLCKFLEEKAVRLGPLLDDTIFSFDCSKAAFDHLYGGKHIGKVVIRI